MSNTTLQVLQTTGLGKDVVSSNLEFARDVLSWALEGLPHICLSLVGWFSFGCSVSVVSTAT